MLAVGFSEQVERDGRVHPTQSAGIGGQGGPAPGPGHVHDVTSTTVEHVSGEEQLVDRAGADSVEVAEHHRGMAQRLSELGPGVRPDRAHLGERECGQVQRQTGGLSGGEPGDGGQATANQRRQC